MFSRELFGQRLRELRKARNMTIEELGVVFDVRKQTVSRWENGERLPYLDLACTIAEYFEVSLDYLAGRESK